MSHGLFFIRASKSLPAINTCLDDRKEFQGRDIAIIQVTIFFLLVTEQEEGTFFKF